MRFQNGTSSATDSHPLQPETQIAEISNERRLSTPDSEAHLQHEISNEKEPEDGEIEDAMDGMVEFTKKWPQGSEGRNFYGETSTFQFALNVRTSAQRCKPLDGLPAADKRSNQNWEAPPKDDDNTEFFNKYLKSSDLQSLPLRHIAERLLNRYFKVVNDVWPFLLEEATRAQFDWTWISSEPQNPLWIAQLNLIMALGCQFYDAENSDDRPFSDVYEAGKQFYRRAQGIVTASAFTVSTIEMLQNLLLMAQYQQGTMRSNQCWLTIGHATRIAQGLGFHLDLPHNNELPPLERELRKRLWWGCFCLDR